MLPAPSSPSATIRVVEALEAAGLPWYEYRLYDSIDPDILQALLKTDAPEIEITFPVRDYQVTFFGDGTVEIEGRN